MTQTLLIVGNGALSRDLSAIAEDAQYVIRFNDARLDDGRSGTRCDLLILANANKPMQRRLTDPDFFGSPAFSNAREIMLVYHPEIIRRYHWRSSLLSRLKGRRADWTMQTIQVIGKAGKEIRIMPPQFYLDSCQELGLDEKAMHSVVPSTGFLGIRYAIDRFPAQEWRIRLCGFTWEGWKRHAWDGERAWVQAQAEAGRVEIIC
ncbi:glycosyltransferase family 29 protein [Limoniibacter endophyticus]|nr:glycosyltransferase family 29 protein [Limoniibacter endophyticus]